MRMTVINRRKNRYETAVPVNLTLPPLLHKKLQELVQLKGFTGPSDYFRERIRMDCGLTLAAIENAQEKND